MKYCWTGMAKSLHSTREASSLVKLRFCAGPAVGGRGACKEGTDSLVHLSATAWLCLWKILSSVILAGNIGSEHRRVCAPKRQERANSLFPGGTCLGVKDCFSCQTTSNHHRLCQAKLVVSLATQSSQNLHRSLCLQPVPHESSHNSKFSLMVDAKLVNSVLLLLADLRGRCIPLSQFKVS